MLLKACPSGNVKIVENTEIEELVFKLNENCPNYLCVKKAGRANTTYTYTGLYTRNGFHNAKPVWMKHDKPDIKIFSKPGETMETWGCY